MGGQKSSTFSENTNSVIFMFICHISPCNFVKCNKNVKCQMSNLHISQGELYLADIKMFECVADLSFSLI